MNLNILNIDLNKTKKIGSLGETDVIAYWVKFCNEALNSEAFLLPYSNDVKRLDNNTISVETSQKVTRHKFSLNYELHFDWFLLK